MYISYYKLNKKPFQISTDPSFFWLGENHKEALSMLKYGVMDDKGFLLLTGDVGTGKTTLINTFVNSLRDEVIVSRVSDPGLTQLDFIKYIAKLFKIETAFETKSEFLILFTEFLEQSERDGQKVLLIIDEAQNLTDETLEEIRLLSNIENQDKKLLNIFLVGQSEFNETLEKYKNRALRQRLTLNFTLYPFKAEETKACIEYRLKVAGAEDEIFTPEAIDEVHTISNGFPRVINIICDHALRLGCQEEQKSISTAIIIQCSKTLHAAHLPQSHQYDSHFGSTNQWLQESEVPPLSPEAIDRVSQPLPDFIVDTEAEIKEKPRPYSAMAPLFLAGLLILGFFLFKQGNLASVSNFLTTLNKSTITSAAKEKGNVNNSPEIVQKTEGLLFSETIPVTEPPPISPVVITKTQNKQRFDVQESEKVFEADLLETDQQAAGGELKPDITAEAVQIVDQPVPIKPVVSTTFSGKLDKVDVEILKQEPVVSNITVTPSVTEGKNTYEEIQEEINTESTLITQPEPSSILENETATVDIEFKEHIPVTSEPTATESSTVTEVLTDDVQEKENVESEVIVEKTIEKEKQSSPQPKVESVPKDIDSTVVQSRVKSEPQIPTASTSTSKKTSDTNDDPGAVIDWLLKSKQS